MITGIMNSAVKKMIFVTIAQEFPTAIRVKALFNLDVLRIVTDSGEYETSLRDKIDRKQVCAMFGLQRLDMADINMSTKVIILTGDKQVKL